MLVFGAVCASSVYPHPHPKQEARCIKQLGGSCFVAPVFPFISIYFGLLTFLVVFLIIISSTRQSGGSRLLLLSFSVSFHLFWFIDFCLAVFLIIISSTRQSGGSWFLLLSFLLRPTSSGLDKCGWTVGASQNPDLFQLSPRNGENKTTFEGQRGMCTVA